MEFLRNAWYIAAWSEELVMGQLVPRTLLEEPVVLFRDAEGHAAALFDRCPHRFAPLSLGKLKGNVIECGYHGLCFDQRGSCTHNPYQPGHIPPRAKVRSYPLLERQGIVWIWMGEAEGADITLAPDFKLFDAKETWQTLHGYLHAPASYQLAIDNLMDLSHPEFLHTNDLGSPALKTANYEVKQEGGRVVYSNRWFDAGPIPPLFERLFPSGGRAVTHWVNMRWEAPSNLLLHVGVTFPGQSRAEGMNAYGGHFLTPETRNTTHYFYSITRTMDEARRLNNDDEMLAKIGGVFEQEDVPMLAAVQRRMGDSDLWSLKPASLPGDAGAVRVRHALDKLLAAERAAR